MLDDALGLQALAVHDVAGLELLLETADIDGQVLDTVAVLEAGQLRKAHRQRGLAALETGTLAAARTGLLAVHAATGGLAGAGGGAAAHALAVLGCACSRLEILQFHVLQLLFVAPGPLPRCWQLAASKLPSIRTIGTVLQTAPIAYSNLFEKHSANVFSHLQKSQ